RFDQKTIDHSFDGMIAAFVEANLFIKRSQLAIDSRADKPIASQLGDLFLEFALTAAHDGRENHHPFAFRQTQNALQDLIDTLARDGLTALRAMRLADRGKKQ